MPLVFVYGSLVSRTSAAQTLGDPLEVIAPALLRGWRRRWSTARDNLASEKTFAPPGDEAPFRFCLGLNIEPDPAGELNGAVLRLTDAQGERLDLREMRYERVEVTGALRGDARIAEPVVTYVARSGHHRPEPPPGAVILATYVRTVEAAFAELGAAELARYRASTDVPPVDVVEGVLVDDRIPAGNPRSW